MADRIARIVVTAVQNAKFDPILRELEGIAAKAWAAPKVSESKYDPYEMPKGF